MIDLPPVDQTPDDTPHIVADFFPDVVEAVDSHMLDTELGSSELSTDELEQRAKAGSMILDLLNSPVQNS